MKISGSRCVRVVKETDEKSVGLARAGSNPADDVFLFFTLSFLSTYNFIIYQFQYEIKPLKLKFTLFQSKYLSYMFQLSESFRLRLNQPF
jgi:hypothetical protein